MNLDPLISFAMLVVFIAWFYGPWQDTCADYARQIIFEERDKLFDLASDGRISFKSGNYKSIRSSLNTAIRFAHELTILRLLFLLSFQKLSNIKDGSEDIEKHIRGIGDQSTQIQIENIRDRAFAAMAGAMLARSLIFVILCVLLSPIVVLMSILYFWWVGFCGFVGRLSRNIVRIIAGAVQEEIDYENKMSASY